MPTSAIELLSAMFVLLPTEEQDEAFERINLIRLRRLAGEESDTARLIRSLLRVVEVIGHAPSVDEYRAEQPKLIAAGEDVAPTSQQLWHFGTWRDVREALEMSEVTTPRRIQARFDSRRLGKIWRYTEESLGDTLAHCVAHYGHVPQVAEFDRWRDHGLQKARAQGNDALHLPSPGPYRRRWKTWEGALRHFGYTPEEIAARLDPTRG